MAEVVPARTKHLVTAALAALLSLVVHQLAYLAAMPIGAVQAGRLGDHGHVATQWALITPLAVLAAASVVLAQIRRLRLASDLTTKPLALAGAGLFVAQEAIESILQTGGLSALVSNPATMLGLALAPILAAVVVVVLRQAGELIARFLDVPAAQVPPQTHVLPRPGSEPFISGYRLLGSSPRGPPRLMPV